MRLQARKVKARLIRKSMASRIPMVKLVAKRTFQNSNSICNVEMSIMNTGAKVFFSRDRVCLWSFEKSLETAFAMQTERKREW